MSDWFAQQMRATEQVEQTPKPRIDSGTRKQVILSIQNKTFYQWNVVIGCVVSNGDCEGTVPIPTITIEPNDSTSHTIQRSIIMTETMRITTIEFIAPLSDSSGIVLHLRNPITLPFHTAARTTNVRVTVDWNQSTTLYGHMVPTMSAETISLAQEIPSE